MDKVMDNPFGALIDKEVQEEKKTQEWFNEPPKELTDKQKLFVKENYKKLTLLELTRKAFNNKKLNGRTLQGKLVKAYVASFGGKTITATPSVRPDIVLNESQKRFVISNMDKMKPFEIAQEMFGITPLNPASKEALAVQNYIRQEAPDQLKGTDVFTSDEYTPPRTVSSVVKKINEACSENLDSSKMPTREKKCVEQLMRYLRSPRFIFTINNFSSVMERQTFEAEFIKTTWNKPDLTADEINLYINVINEYILQNRIMKILEKLNNALEGQTSNDSESVKISMSLSDAIKGKTDEYHKSVNRQEGLVKQLEGERSKRINRLGGKNISIATLVEIFREEEERKNLLRIAEERKKLIKSEAKKLEGLDETIARVFGMHMEEL